jgi:hypothetical protein
MEIAVAQRPADPAGKIVVVVTLVLGLAVCSQAAA